MSECNLVECNSIENADLNYYQKNKDVVLSKAKDYYKNNKDRLREQARDKYRNFSEEEKNKKENMEKIDITRREENKTKRISKKLLRG